MFGRLKLSIVSGIVALFLLLGSVIAVTCFWGDKNVLGDLSMEVRENAVTLIPGGSVNVEAFGSGSCSCFKFVPERTAYYEFYTYDLTEGDPTAYLYNYFSGDYYRNCGSETDISDSNKNIHLRTKLTEGETYYYVLYHSGYDNLICKAMFEEWDPITVQLTGVDYHYSYNERYSCFSDLEHDYISYYLEEDGPYNIIIDNPNHTDEVEYTYHWEKYNDETGAFDDLNVTGNTITDSVPQARYECFIDGPEDDDDITYTIYIYRDYQLHFSEEACVVEYYLTEPGTWMMIDPEFDVDEGVSYQPHISRQLFAVQADYTENIYDRRNPSGVVFPNGVRGFLGFNYMLQLEGNNVNPYVVTSIIKSIEIFVLQRDSDGNLITDGTLVPDETLRVSVNNEIDSRSQWPRYLDNEGYEQYDYQRIYTFTPESNGTITIDASDIDVGVPTIVLFDQDYNYICSAGGDRYFDYYGELAYPATEEDDNTLGFGPVSLEADVEAGKTYYIAIPVFYLPNYGTIFYEERYMPYDYAEYDALFGERSNIDYDLTLSFEASEITDPGQTEPSVTDPSEPSTEPSSETANTPAPSGSVPTQEPTAAVTPVASDQEDNGSSTPENVITEVVTPSDNTVDDFVGRLYTIALGREADEAGLQDWVDAVTLRGETGADVARGFLYSPEFINRNVSNEEFVGTLYMTFFGREAEEAGLNGWVAVLDGGESKENVIEGFINSTEWANLCLLYGIRNGGTGVPSIDVEPNAMTIEFATRLYTTCLRRDADEPGMLAWARQLANQRDTGTGAAYGFFFSEEFINQNVDNAEYVDRLYRTFMGREADEDGFNAWVAQLDSGVSREEVFNGFAESPEFGRICAAYGIIR